MLRAFRTNPGESKMIETRMGRVNVPPAFAANSLISKAMGPASITTALRPLKLLAGRGENTTTAPRTSQ